MNTANSNSAFGATFNINRRRFLQTAAADGCVGSPPFLRRGAVDIANGKTRRVGLIGAGWYGPSDLWRLIQVAPAEVVAICDPDQNMLHSAVEIASQRQKSHNKPAHVQRLSRDAQGAGARHRAHRLARPLACLARDRRDGSGRRRLSAEADQRRRARRRSDARRRPQAQPSGAGRHAAQEHAAPDRGEEAGRRRRPAGQRSATSRCAATSTCGPTAIRRSSRCRISSTTKCGPAPRRCGRTTGLPHRRWWRTFTEYGNGIVGDMCVHMLDTVRWMLDLGWPKRISSSGGIYVQKEGKSNISDTQTATFEYDDFNAVWQHRTWGTPPDPDYPWALFIYGEKGTLKASTMRADFIPHGESAKPIHFDCVFEREQVSRRRDRKGHRAERRPRHAPAHARFPGRDRPAQPTGGRHRRRPHLHRELHSREYGHEIGPAARLRPDAKASRGRRRGDAVAEPAVSRTVGSAKSCVTKVLECVTTDVANSYHLQVSANEPGGTHPTTYGLKVPALKVVSTYKCCTNDVRRKGRSTTLYYNRLATTAQELSVEQLRFVLTVVERECARPG